VAQERLRHGLSDTGMHVGGAGSQESARCRGESSDDPGSFFGCHGRNLARLVPPSRASEKHHEIGRLHISVR
jgi:hypothetical protein